MNCFLLKLRMRINRVVNSYLSFLFFTTVFHLTNYCYACFFYGKLLCILSKKSNVFYNILLNSPIKYWKIGKKLSVTHVRVIQRYHWYICSSTKTYEQPSFWRKLKTLKNCTWSATSFIANILMTFRNACGLEFHVSRWHLSNESILI